MGMLWLRIYIFVKFELFAVIFRCVSGSTDSGQRTADSGQRTADKRISGERPLGRSAAWRGAR